MTDPTSLCRVPIVRYEVDHAEKTLGVLLSMDGDFTAEYYRLLKMAEKFADNIRTKKVSPTETWYTFHASFMKSEDYSMDAISLTK